MPMIYLLQIASCLTKHKNINTMIKIPRKFRICVYHVSLWIITESVSKDTVHVYSQRTGRKERKPQTGMLGPLNCRFGCFLALSHTCWACLSWMAESNTCQWKRL